MDVRKAKPILYDPLIIPRVKQYLEENVHQTYVDVSVMARHLQEKYREYNRRKVQPFRNLVDQAYKTVLHSYGLDSNPSSDEDEENSDLELMDDSAVSGNHMNNMLTNMYGANKDSAIPQDGEFIDISSDDSDTENGERRKTNNGRPPKDASKNAKDATQTRKEVLPVEPDEDAVNANTSKNHVAPITEAPIVIQPPVKKRKIDKLDLLNETTTSKSNKDSVPVRPSKRFKKEFSKSESPLTFENVGGIDKILKELCELLLHIKHPDVYKHIGLPPPRGFLLHGPPGCGKTLLAQAIAGQLQVGLIQVAATELIAGVSGESEERIRDLFEQAASQAPCVLFIDEIDAISSNRLNAQKDMERRIVSQLLISLDGLSNFEKGEQVLVIGATNRADVLDPALRRVGRFDQEICLGIPDREARSQILRVICNNLRLAKLFDYDAIAALTPGYVGADLLALATRAASLAVKRILHEKEEKVLKKSIDKTTEKHSIPDVNLSDDLLMDIDSTLDKVPEKDNDQPMDGVTETKSSAPNNTQETKENDVDVVTVEQKDDESTKLQAESDKTGEKIEQIATEVKTILIDDQGGTAGKDNEKEKEKVVEMVGEGSSKETLGEALLKNAAIKDQMGLDVMFKWLSNVEPLVSNEELSELYITMDDFNKATKLVQPSAKREGFITVPDVTWDDIGSLRNIRDELSLAILAPVKFPNRLKTLGLQAPFGVLLCGPPGCGKTLLAKAVANEAGINFISVKGPELLNMYVGESERAVRQCFQRARNSAPCVIFFDEFDALCPKRSGSSEGNASSRVVNQLLTEMDGVEERNGVFLLAATNRPDMVDPAVLRPGRLDKILYVGLPEVEDRLEILQAITKKGTKPTIGDDVNFGDLAQQTDSFTGADLAGLVRQASIQALKESLAAVDQTSSDNDLKVTSKHFSLALQQLRPSISTEDKVRYEKLRLKYAVVPEK